MAKSVNTRRAYHSPRRIEQAAATRRAILESAQRCFEADGYASTSMATIAGDAGVSLKTVYLSFATKSGLLHALWNLLLRDDEAQVPVGERPWFRAVLEEPDAERRLRLNIRNGKTVRSRIGRLFQVIRDGAPADPEVAELWQRIQSEFHANQRSVVASLHRDGSLRPGLNVARATDILWTLNHPDLYWLLVGERGWTPDQHEEWVADLVCNQLLNDVASVGRRRR
jgi:AcrR family transcriptional regulator